MYDKPLVIHCNEQTIFLFDWQDPTGEIEKELLLFTTLKKAPEEIHAFEISPYSVWAAAAKGINGDYILNFLDNLSLNGVSSDLRSKVYKWVLGFGNLQMKRSGIRLQIICKTAEIMNILMSLDEIKGYIYSQFDDVTLNFMLEDRSKIKEILFNNELFVIDSSNVNGERLDITILPSICLKPYQLDAIESFSENMDKTGGGVLILPPASGKTLVGLSICSKINLNTLIIVEDNEGIKQWIAEIQDKTDYDIDTIGTYNKLECDVYPITICTYSFLSQNEGAYKKIMDHQWGLIIFDDAHRLPAETYMKTTDIPSKYKLALASTLSRSDCRGNLVLALIGPKWYETYPKLLEKQGYVSPVECLEIRIPLTRAGTEQYRKDKDSQQRRKTAALNSNKKNVLMRLSTDLWNRKMLVVSYRKDLCIQLSREFNNPLMLSDGKDYKDIVKAFENGEHPILFGTNGIVEQTLFQLLDVLVSTSYHQGSTREEYLRIGKLSGSRVSGNKKYAIALVTDNSVELSDYVTRRRDMIRLGYVFKILTYDQIMSGGGFFES